MNKQEHTIENQVIALAAVAQAATLIDRLARTGQDDSEAFKTLVHGLLEMNPRSTAEIYIDPAHLRTGYQTLCYLLQSGGGTPETRQNNAEIMRYCLSMLHLERKLVTRKDMLDTVGHRLEQVKAQIEHFRPSDESGKIHGGYLHKSVLANIASVYTDTLSTLRFRVQVNGNPTHLQQEQVVHRIRTLLLCGIRAAVLWRQIGGTRLGLLLKRKDYARIATGHARLH